ncbi:MAG: PTS sugar transporter subunit IIA [Tetragenococcus sp.]|nr:PTS sugar transporter subunit IIA [Tetragenococcus sp.]
MIEKSYMFKTSFKSKEELFKEGTLYLEERGYVTNEFEGALNEREKEFPTGLPTEPSVAIPHTDGTYVKKNTILCILNDTKIAFNEMGGDEEDYVYPQVFFLLALSDGKEHLEQLQNLVEKLQSGNLVTDSLQANNTEEFRKAVENYL